MLINTNQSFYDSELDDRSETPTNNNPEPLTPVDERRPLAGESLTRENINACIEEFTKMWAPVEKSSGKDQINNNSPNEKFDTIQTSRSSSFRYTDFKRNGVHRTTETGMVSLSLEIDPNAWDLPAPSEPLAESNASNCAISDAESSLATPRAVSPIDDVDTKRLELISTGDERNDSDEEDNQSTYDLMHLMLEPHLRPVSPEPNNQTSKEIFDDHKRLAKEYFKVVVKFRIGFHLIADNLNYFRLADSNGNRVRDQTQRRAACCHG